MDLISLVLSLHPRQPPAPDTSLPSWWGRAAHSLLLNVVRRYDENLAAGLHEPPQLEDGREQAGTPNPVRPFTTSTLMGHFVNRALDPAGTYTLRLTAFREDVAGILSRAALEGPLAPGQILELDYIPFEIVSVHSGEKNPKPGITGDEAVAPPNSSPWAAAATYQGLSAPYLLAKENAPRRISLQFTSPTTFKSGGRHMPIPLPGLVFGSLLERWNAYAPVIFPPEVKRYAEECLAVSKYDLQTRPVPVKSGGLRVGALGYIAYTTMNYDRYWMSVIATLAEFALFSGTGAGTASGLGQVRRIRDRRQDPGD